MLGRAGEGGGFCIKITCVRPAACGTTCLLLLLAEGCVSKALCILGGVQCP